MTHGSLFSGIGGFDLAAEWMGWENKFHCENNQFCQKVLNYYWPKAISYDDIKTTDFAIHRGTVDILTGGFPCQPYSAAGKRKGNEDDRHLWPQMLRAIREVRPCWVVGENVLGLLNWSKGLVFHQVQTDLEAEGFFVFPYVLPACAVNAPHRRDRVWFVSRLIPNSCSNGQQWTKEFKERCESERGRIPLYESNSFYGGGIITYTGSKQQQDRTQNSVTEDRKEESRIPIGERLPGCDSTGTNWSDWPTQPPLCSRNDGIPSKLDGITFSKHRQESIKAYGNAIVPEVAYMIFKAIEKYEMQIKAE